MFTLDYHALAPELILAVTVVVTLSVDVFSRRKEFVAIIGIIGMFAAAIPILTLTFCDSLDFCTDGARIMFDGAYVVDTETESVPGEHALVTEPLDGVGRTLAWALCARIHHVAYLLEHVDEHVLFERRERRPVGPQVKAGKKAQVERFQIQIDPVTCESGDEAARIRWHQ